MSNDVVGIGAASLSVDFTQTFTPSLPTLRSEKKFPFEAKATEGVSHVDSILSWIGGTLAKGKSLIFRFIRVMAHPLDFYFSARHSMMLSYRASSVAMSLGVSPLETTSLGEHLIISSRQCERDLRNSIKDLSTRNAERLTERWVEKASEIYGKHRDLCASPSKARQRAGNALDIITMTYSSLLEIELINPQALGFKAVDLYERVLGYVESEVAPKNLVLSQRTLKSIIGILLSDEDIAKADRSIDELIDIYKSSTEDRINDSDTLRDVCGKEVRSWIDLHSGKKEKKTKKKGQNLEPKSDTSTRNLLLDPQARGGQRTKKI
jgi:hypothetical protein